MNLQQQWPDVAQWRLSLPFEEGVCRMWVCRPCSALRPRTELPSIDQTSRNFASADVRMTSLL